MDIKKKIFIRNLIESDWKYFKKWWRDSYLISLTSGNFEVVSLEKLHNGFLKMLESKDTKNFMILKEDRVVIGHMSLEMKKDKAEFTIVIGNKKYLGKGYGTLATKKIISLAFKKYKLEKLFLKVRPENVRAIRAYEKSGFKRVGIRKYKNVNQPKLLVMMICDD